MRIDWSRPDIQESVKAVAGLNSLSILGRGCRSTVFASKCGAFALKLTADKQAYRLLERLKAKPVAHLPHVEGTFGVVGSLPDGTELFLASMERLHEGNDPTDLAKKLRRVWQRALYKDTGIRAIPPSQHSKFPEHPHLREALEFIDEFTADTGSCFDADTKSNLMFREDGTPVLFDPVWST